MQAAAFSACAADSGFAQERPPRILEIYREFWKPENVVLSRKIEVEASQICIDLKCPHPCLGLESLTGPKEAWFLNGFVSSSEQTQVGENYQKNPDLIKALNQNQSNARAMPAGDGKPHPHETPRALEPRARTGMPGPGGDFTSEAG